MSDSATPARPGRATRIGVTGHRVIPAAAYRHVRAGLTAALRPQGSAGPVEAFSSLATGADQLFAAIALDSGADLTVVTPAADYETTFGPAERDCFRHLLARARRHIALDYERVSGEAYFAAGAYIADRCDLMVAVWDGLPARGHGGTAEIVDYTRALGKPVSVIWKTGVARD
ncbi:hypothetical protein ABZ901_25465 [Actinacidiphila alni]|uniref:hypothetical protein n=1 Tax=Actinacidiphila alni TaxID=380248 RepID=UPI003400D0E7